MNGYPYVIPLQVRWRDIDAFRHVNNAAIVSYLETARAEMWREYFSGSDAMDIPFVISHLEVDYQRPISLYDEVLVGLRATDITRSSFSFEYLIQAQGLTAAIARTLQVCVRHESGRPVRVPELVGRTLAKLVTPSP